MKRFVNTKVVWQWDEDAQDYVLIKKQGYWYDGPMSLAMDTPTMSQDSIQLFNDDGTDETDSTSKAGVGVDITGQALDVNLLVRFLVKEIAGNANSNYKPQLQINLNGGTYQDVDGASTIGQSSNSTKLTDGENCTQRIGSGTFVTENDGVDDVNGAAGSAAVTFVGNDEAEFTYCFQILSADVSAGEFVRVRISDAQIDSYVDLEIQITIEAGGAISATIPLAFGKSAADLKANGKLDAMVALILGAPVVDLQDASGVSAISATSALALAFPSADLEAKGKLDATAALIFGAPVVDLKDATAVGAISATVALAFGVPVVDIRAKGKLDATAALAFASPSTDLTAKGKLDATAALAFGAPVVDLKDAPGVGAIAATVALAFTVSANLTALGKLSSLVPMAFVVSADLSDASAVGGPFTGRHLAPFVS